MLVGRSSLATAFAVFALSGCGSRSELPNGASVDASCAPVACPSLHTWDSASCACVPQRCPDDSGETVIAEITSDFADGTAIAVVDGEVYFATRAGKTDSDGVVSKVSRCGGAMTPLATQQIGPVALAIGAGTVFFGTLGDDNTGIAKGGVFRVPANGGPTTQIAKGMIFAGGITTDASYVYWTGLSGTSGLYRASLAGGVPEAIGPDQVFYYVAADQKRFYLSQPATVPKNSRLVSMPLAGGDVSVLVPENLAGAPMTIDESFVYYSVTMNGQVTLARVPKAGGAQTKIAAREVNALAVDSTHLYWVQGNATSGESYQLDRAPKAGGAPEKLSDVGGYALALDETYVYWLIGGAVRRLPK